MDQTVQILNSKSDEQLAAEGYKPETIAKIRTAAGTNPESQSPPLVLSPDQPEMVNAPVAPAPVEQPLPTEVAAAQPAQATLLPNGQIVEADVNAQKQEGKSILQKQREAAEKATQRKREREAKEEQEKEISKAKLLGISPEEFAKLKNEFSVNPVAQVEQSLEEQEAPASPEEQGAFNNAFTQLMKTRAREISAEDTYMKLLSDQERRIQELSRREIDPTRYWKNKTSGEKAWLIIGSAFSQKGGNNSVLNMVHQEINRDVAAQKEAIDNEIKALQGNKDLLKLQMTLAKKGTPNTRALAHELNVIDATIEQGKRLGAKPKANQEAVAQMLGSLQQRRQQVEIQLADTLNSGAKLADDLVGANTPRHLMDDKQQERFVPGYGLARNPASAEKFATYAAEMKNASDGIKRALELADKTQKLNPFSKDRALLEQELVATIGALRLPFTGPGPLLEAEYERIKDAIGNPNNILSYNSLEKAKLLNVVKKLENDVDSKAAVTFNGYKPKTNQFKTFQPK
jgi:hypothetical protein